MLKISHYIGSLESWLERGGGKGTAIRPQNAEGWRKRIKERGPFVDYPDVRMGYWVDMFLSKVGTDAAEGLLFKPLRHRIAFVKSMLGVSTN